MQKYNLLSDRQRKLTNNFSDRISCIRQVWKWSALLSVSARSVASCQALQGFGRLPLVAVRAAEEVVGADLLIRGTVAVEEVGGVAQKAVGGQLGIDTIERVGLVEEGEHLAVPTAMAGGQ